MNKHLLPAMLLMLTMMGCSKTVEVKLDPEVVVFLSDNSKATIVLTAKDQEYRMLQQWLAQHKAQWLSTSGRYAGGVYLTSGDLGIQVTDSKVVLYTQITKSPTAIYAQEIARADLKALKNINRRLFSQ